MTISTSWDPALSQALGASRDRLNTEAQEGLRQIGDAGVAILQAAIKGGKFGQSVSAQQTGMTVEIGSDSPMAALIEKGRRPGRRPPPQLLQRSMSLSAKAAVKAADRIQKTGTKGRRYVEFMNRDLQADELPRIVGDTAARMADLKPTI